MTEMPAVNRHTAMTTGIVRQLYAQRAEKSFSAFRTSLRIDHESIGNGYCPPSKPAHRSAALAAIPKLDTVIRIYLAHRLYCNQGVSGHWEKPCHARQTDLLAKTSGYGCV